MATPSAAGRDVEMLAVRNLEVVYDDLALALRGVSLAIAEGEVVALLGANGAGKTTLLRAVTGLLDIHRGKVTKSGVTLQADRVMAMDFGVPIIVGTPEQVQGDQRVIDACLGAAA